MAALNKVSVNGPALIPNPIEEPKNTIATKATINIS